jgi:hypothetical protein
MADESPADGYFKVYEEYSKTLRTWFVAYGIGAPVLLLNNDELRKAVIATGAAKRIALYFLVGVGLQIAVTALNKAVAWIVYAELETNATAARKATAAGTTVTVAVRTWYQELADWVSEQFWIDLGADILTGAAFVYGTYRIFGIASGTG